MDMAHYIFENGEVRPEADLMTWARWMQIDNRRVARTSVGAADVSTVFLGINHNYGDGAPILFETMVFGGQLDQYQWRYRTLEEAMHGHERVVENVRKARRWWWRVWWRVTGRSLTDLE